MQQIFAFGKVNRTLMNYTKEPLTGLDKRLLKGFYVANTHELEGKECEHTGVSNEGVDMRRLNGIMEQYRQAKVRRDGYETIATPTLSQLKNYDTTETSKVLNTNETSKVIHTNDTPKVLHPNEVLHSIEANKVFNMSEEN